MIPLSVKLNIPEGTKTIQELEYPEPTKYHDYLVYRGDAILHGRIEIASANPVDISAKINYQACSETSCLPPAEQILTQTISIR